MKATGLIKNPGGIVCAEIVRLNRDNLGKLRAAAVASSGEVALLVAGGALPSAIFFNK